MADAPTDPTLEEEVITEEGEPDAPDTPEVVTEPETETDELETGDEEPEGEPEGEPEPQPSKREQKRVADLLRKYPDLEQPELPQVPKGIDYENELDADPEVTKRLQEDREAYARAMYEEGLRQNQALQFHTRLEIDAPRVEAKHPILDQNSDKFNPNFARDVNTLYLAVTGYQAGDARKGTPDRVSNPNIRYADFVETLMRLADEGAAVKSEQTRKAVTKTAALTGLRPDGSTAKRMNLNQAPQAMSDEELDAIISQALPKK